MFAASRETLIHTASSFLDDLEKWTIEDNLAPHASTYVHEIRPVSVSDRVPR